MKIKKQCGNCKYYDRIEDDEGCCSRYPPVLIDAELWSDGEGWASPTVFENYYCGEFKLKEEFYERQDD